VTHAAEIGVNVPLGPDPDEDGAAPPALRPDPDRPEDVLRDGVRRLAPQVEVGGGERVRARRKALGAGGVVAVRVAREHVDEHEREPSEQ